MTGKFAVAAAVAFYWLLAASPALAGFRIQEADLEFPKDITSYSFQGGKARVDGALEGLTVIIDLNSGEGWLVDSASRRYSGGKFVELEWLLKKIEGSLDKDDALDDPAGRRAAAEAAKPHTVVVKDLGAGERLQGYDTRRFQVLVDGELLEELWLAPKLQVASEIDPVAFGTALQKMIGGGPGLIQGYEGSEMYRTMRAGGYALRQVLYFVGEKSTIEVTSVAIKDFPPSDFVVPKGFSKIGYVELLLGGND